MRILLVVSIFFLMACGGGDNYKSISDLPFKKAESAKAYADLIIKSIRTNREEPVYQEFESKEGINLTEVQKFVQMYSTGIGGRDDWEYIDVYRDSENKDDKNGFDYAWLDPNGRLAMQIRVIPAGTASGFKLGKIEFRSRMEVMDSKAFPGGDINDYEKLNYDWDANMKRKLEEQK